MGGWSRQFELGNKGVNGFVENMNNSAAYVISLSRPRLFVCCVFGVRFERLVVFCIFLSFQP